jgi:LacI family transcriptional regulator
MQEFQKANSVMSTIGAGLGRPERSKVTLEVIARTLGVSTATVSLALRDNPVVAEATKRHVQRAAREMGYVYNRSAAALRTSRTNTLGVAFHDLRNPYFAEMLATLVDSVAEMGRSILLGSCGDDLDRQSRVLETLKEHRPDGIIVCPVTGSDGDSLNHLLAAGIPVVQVARQVDGLDADFVGADTYHGTVLAMEHLLELGHTRIALVGGSRRTSTGREREQSYRDCLERAGLPFNENLVLDGSGQAKDGADAIAVWEAQNDRATAFLCFNDAVALGAIAAARRIKIDVPDDLSIVGTDDVEVSNLVHPGLTTIHANHMDIAKQAAELMARRIDDPEHERMSIILKPELVLRGTTAPAH